MIDLLSNFKKHYAKRLLEFYPTGKTDLSNACIYALRNQGKLIRPQLVLLCHGLYCDDPQSVFDAACAVEWVHTYSLVHDDLPCMDDASLRRGQPTVHKRYGEATALLVGDALLSDAFLLISQMQNAGDPHPNLGLIVQELASACGGQGMVLGQALDLYWTHRQGYTSQDLRDIHRQKTGRLFSASCAIGAWAAKAPPDDVRQLKEFGAIVGLLFQLQDDTLDMQSSEETGKDSNKDQSLEKLTFLRVASLSELNSLKESMMGECSVILSGLRATQPRILALDDFFRKIFL